jgi:hypothetical protein
MNLKVLSLTAIAVAALTAPAFAHHSFAMFDAEQTLTFQGTVKEFEWRNPHAWLRVTVNDEKSGKPVLWALELSSPARLVTMGMRADSVKEGDAVSVTFHPMKDGTRGGQFTRRCSRAGSRSFAPMPGTKIKISESGFFGAVGPALQVPVFP